MNQSDPRPMPPQVLAAYRDPLDLRALLASSVFTDSDRLAVRDKLLERLATKHGNVEVELNGKLITIRKRIAPFRKNVLASVKIIIDTREYGGPESVLLDLAHVMEPYWMLWWESMKWENLDDARHSLRTASAVLGPRQMGWIASQFARSVYHLVDDGNRKITSDAIHAAESFAVHPIAPHNEEAIMAELSSRNTSLTDAAAYSANKAVCASISYGSYGAEGAIGAVQSAVVSRVSSVYGTDVNERAIAAVDASAAIYSEFAALTKQLITPTLITTPSRGLR